MDTKIKKKIEKLKYLLQLEKNEEDIFFGKQFRDFSFDKIAKAVKDGICWYPLLFKREPSTVKT